MTSLQEISAHDRQLAHEVCDKVAELGLDGTHDDCARILFERFPSRDSSGVSHAHRRTRARIMRALYVLRDEREQARRDGWEALGEQRYSEHAP